MVSLRGANFGPPGSASLRQGAVPLPPGALAASGHRALLFATLPGAGAGKNFTLSVGGGGSAAT